MAINPQSVDLVLPKNSVKLVASSWPVSDGFSYHWVKTQGPDSGNLDGINEKEVVLSDVSQG